MTVETPPNVIKNFQFSFPTCTNENVLFKLEVPVEIPHAGSTRELVQRVINMFHIPVYLEDELNEKLAAFVADETRNFHNERDAKLLDQLKNAELDVESIVKGWEKQFKENVVEFAEQVGTSDEEVFAAAYHRLVHSPALDTILQVEDSYARTTRNTLRAKEHDINTLTQRQGEEMEEAVRIASTRRPEEAEAASDAVSALAATHLEQQALAAGRWGSQLDALQHAQRAAHRAWLMRALDNYQTNTPHEIQSPSDSPLGSFPEGPLAGAEAAPGREAASRLEESFTIHLGSQLKQTHNIRISASDLLELCFSEDVDNPTETSRRLQTSLGLYGSELSAVVLLCESSLSRPAGVTKSLLDAAASSTEHHFQSAETQLRVIGERVKDPVLKRNLSRLKEQVDSGKSSRRVASADLQCGDVFITTHSNLPDVHVVFHLVVDDTLKSGDITSRHPAILGLRNILKAASSNDVTSIALPLLLSHEHTEEMTAAWCVRRAELVLKCVKGFMVEAGCAGGAELRTLHAAAPANTSAAVFQHLVSLTPNIFRLSNPVKFKPPADEAGPHSPSAT